MKANRVFCLWCQAIVAVYLPKKCHWYRSDEPTLSSS